MVHNIKDAMDHGRHIVFLPVWKPNLEVPYLVILLHRGISAAESFLMV